VLSSLPKKDDTFGFNSINHYMESLGYFARRHHRQQIVANKWQNRHSYFQALGLAIAISIVIFPGWTNVGVSQSKIGQNLPIERTTEETQANESATIVDNNTGKISIILIVEIVMAGLLSVGFFSVYLANRAKRRLLVPATVVGEAVGKQPVKSAEIAVARLTRQFVEKPEPTLEIESPAIAKGEILKAIALRLRQCIYLEDLLRTSVIEVRRVLKSDRVSIYSLNPANWEGTIVAESVDTEYPQTLNLKIDDPCFRMYHVEMYKQGRTRAINNIHQDLALTECHIKMLEQFGVKAGLIAPILRNEQLLGLLIAHQCMAPRVWQPEEIDLFAGLAVQIGLTIDQVNFIESQDKAVERAQLLREITLKLRETLTIEELLATAVKEIRRAIKSDRVIIYSLDPDYHAKTVVGESVGSGWSPTLKLTIDDPCLDRVRTDSYKYGYVRAVNDIYQEPTLNECHIKLLEQFGVKAKLVAPILNNDRLFGLLIAHQCYQPRNWEKAETDLFAQLASQVGFALSQLSLFGKI
jgi:methyl-accepting chemotaxis protein PixJ